MPHNPKNSGLEPFSDEELDNVEVNEELNPWWKVVIFYSLRLALTPVIETVILLDWCLFLLENNCNNIMFPLFDVLEI